MDYTRNTRLAEPRQDRARVHRKIERWGWGRDRISGLTEHQVESKVFVGGGVQNGLYKGSR